MTSRVPVAQLDRAAALLTKLTVILVILTLEAFVFAGYQIGLIRKQIRGEVYKKAKIKGTCFFLPDKRAYVAKTFESAQQEWDEIEIGKQIEVQ